MILKKGIYGGMIWHLSWCHSWLGLFPVWIPHNRGPPSIVSFVDLCHMLQGVFLGSIWRDILPSLPPLSQVFHPTSHHSHSWVLATRPCLEDVDIFLLFLHLVSSTSSRGTVQLQTSVLLPPKTNAFSIKCRTANFEYYTKMARKLRSGFRFIVFELTR